MKKTVLGLLCVVAFEACVRHGSVTRAAEELSLAQPTVSCLVRKLSVDIKILGEGELTKTLSVTAHSFSKSAVEKIEDAEFQTLGPPSYFTIRFNLVF